MTKKTKDMLYTIGFAAMILFGLYMFFRPPVIVDLGNNTFAVKKTSSFYDRDDISKLANDHCNKIGLSATLTKYEPKSSGSGKFGGTLYRIKFKCA